MSIAAFIYPTSCNGAYAPGLMLHVHSLVILVQVAIDHNRKTRSRVVHQHARSPFGVVCQFA